LRQNKYTVTYIETWEKENDCRQLVACLSKQKVTDIHICEVADNWLLKRKQRACRDKKKQLKI